VDQNDDRSRGREEEARVEPREQSVIELMNGPLRPTAQRQRTVLWISLAFATLMLAMTCAVIHFYGLDILTLFTAVALGFVVAAMIGALRYKGVDPMAQFDPEDRPPPRRFWHRK
jgi:cytosine/uracil/thiamine/allantoin permease